MLESANTAIYEPIPLETLLITSISKVSRVGPNVQLWLTLPDETSEAYNDRYEVVRAVCKIAVPNENLRGLAERLIAIADALQIKEAFEEARRQDALEAPRPPRGGKPHLVTDAG